MKIIPAAAIITLAVSACAPLENPGPIEAVVCDDDAEPNCAPDRDVIVKED